MNVNVSCTGAPAFGQVDGSMATMREQLCGKSLGAGEVTLELLKHMISTTELT
jgi:hypothetical protein